MAARKAACPGVHCEPGQVPIDSANLANLIERATRGQELAAQQIQDIKLAEARANSAAITAMSEQHALTLRYQADSHKMQLEATVATHKIQLEAANAQARALQDALTAREGYARDLEGRIGTQLTGRTMDLHIHGQLLERTLRAETRDASLHVEAEKSRQLGAQTFELAKLDRQLFASLPAALPLMSLPFIDEAKIPMALEMSSRFQAIMGGVSQVAAGGAPQLAAPVAMPAAPGHPMGGALAALLTVVREPSTFDLLAMLLSFATAIPGDSPAGQIVTALLENLQREAPTQALAAQAEIQKVRAAYQARSETPSQGPAPGTDTATPPAAPAQAADAAQG